MLKYDDANPLSIKEYGELLIGQTFFDVLDTAAIDEELKQETITKVNNPRYKGGMGHLIEKYHFEYEINNNQEPDFPKAGVELKVTPYEIGKRGGYSAGERLVITMISYEEAVEEDFLTSHAYRKLFLTLFVHYLRNRSLSRIEYPIHYVTLFSPPEADLKIIQEDYEKIVTKVKEGRAHELSEGDTLYLGACTKGANSIKSNVPQKHYAPEVKARKRAFCFKQSYMTQILNQYVIPHKKTYKEPESIIKDVNELNNQTFEQLIVNKINRYVNQSAGTLAQKLNVTVSPKSKNYYSTIAFRMLNIRSNRAAEFEKANIEIKTIRLEENNTIEQHMSFPHIKLKEFADETWEESSFYETMSTKKFLFVVFKKQGSEYFLKGCQLWNMSNKDLEEVFQGWKAIQDVLKQGVLFSKKYNKNGDFIVNNNFPGIAKHRILHIRPHTTERYYVLEGNEIIGNKPIYGDELPDGRIMTKQCFWLNNTYIFSLINEKLKQ